MDAERMGLPEHLMRHLETQRGFTGLTPVQARALKYLYGRQDVAMCAPTGSGKTLALCIGLIARLMRDGPMSPQATLFLCPSLPLCRQVAKWLRELWWFPDDELLVYEANNCESPMAMCRELHVNRTRASYILLGTPDVWWAYYNARKEQVLAHRRRGAKSSHSLALTPVMPSVDTIIVDEVDEVLPPSNPEAPGNLLMTELYRHVKYQAPLQLVFSSATLSGSVVNHVRRFMKKHLLESRTTRLFENAVATTSPGSAPSGRSSRVADAIMSRVAIPANISHAFYTADTIAEQRLIFQQLVDGLAADGAYKVLVILPDRVPRDVTLEQLLVHLVPQPSLVVALEAIAGQPTLPKAQTLSVASDAAFSGPRFELLVCTASQSRGIDIDTLTHCWIFAQPQTMLEYAHWCGRVGRLGNSGACATVMPRSFVRTMSNFCENLEIRFTLHKRFA